MPPPPTEAEAAFSDALARALATPGFLADGGKLGSLASTCTRSRRPRRRCPESPASATISRGETRRVAVALMRTGLEPRVVPYFFETCAGESWRLHRHPSERERQVFARKRLKGSSLESKLPDRVPR